MLAVVDAVLDGAADNGFALVRPPGHHSTAGRRRWASACSTTSRSPPATRSAAHGIERVAIVDWDVHHGNGTQAVFYDDPSVLFVSLHQDDLYPIGSGTLEQIGDGAGEGLTVNVPLPAGTGDAGYLLAWDRVVEPALADFGPDLLFISAGQDPAAADPLGRMSVTTEGFRALTARAKEFAERACGGRLVVALEGGYSLDHLPFCNLAIVEALAGLEPSFDVDPLELDVPQGRARVRARRGRTRRPRPRPRGARTPTGGQDLLGGALAGLDRALEIALVGGRGVLAGEVDRALGLADVAVVARVLARQEGGVGAARPGIGDPAVGPGATAEAVARSRRARSAPSLAEAARGCAPTRAGSGRRVGLVARAARRRPSARRSTW